MYVWFSGRKIKNSFIEFVKIEKYYDLFNAISKDQSITKYATNLVFLTKADKSTDVESKIFYSILSKQPKRADVYWLLHVDILDDPHMLEYRVTHLIPDVLFKIDFKLGFKVQPRINLFFRQVIEEMSRNNEINLVSRYDSLRKFDIPSDFRFVLIDRIQNYDFDFPPKEQFIMDIYSILKRFGISEVRAMGLDTSNVTIETVPLVIDKDASLLLTRNE